ncbi:MAG: V-type ATP synthase subunit A [Clostridia bacterium]|nr:V-type ATP synthase subunit A [Clostridia bacterium]
MEAPKGIISKVSGPLVVARGMENVKLFDVVMVSDKKLIGEIVEIRGDKASIQVYEDTAGLGPGEPVYTTNQPLMAELGPGLIESIYDGIQRPLEGLFKATGEFIQRGVQVPALNREKKWEFQPILEKGVQVKGGDVLGKVQETILIEHKVMVPPGVEGELVVIKNGEFTIEEVIAEVKTPSGENVNICMMQKWPVRQGRPYNKRLATNEPMVTGQRIVDTFFPVTKGGTAAIPGPFGSGKTVVQHQLAKWSDAQVVIFIGCGERGNEMTDVLMEFPELKDPKSGHPLMKRTVLIANTSNMPVAAREASIYTGLTIAEYFRDMGYSVALMADSSSRWAEALREMSGRLEEMPGEEGYPAYLGSRLASFYERAGKVKCLGQDMEREGALTVIGAVSPPGGDLSEPVTQNTLRIVKVFWSLDYKLAHARHFPAINWLNSYSLYNENISEYISDLFGSSWNDNKNKALRILQEEAELEEIVRLVGIDALSTRERIILETAKSLREDFLQQNAFDDEDAYSSLKKQHRIIKLVLSFYDEAMARVEAGEEIDIDELFRLPVRVEVARAHFIPEEELERFEELEKKLREAIRNV